MLYILSILLKSSSLLLLVGACLLLFRKARASVKHFMISGTMLGLLLLPALIEVMPRIEISMPYKPLIVEEVATKNTNKSTPIATVSHKIPSSISATENSTTVEKEQTTTSKKIQQFEEKDSKMVGVAYPTLSLIQLIYGIWLIGSLYFLVRFLLGAFIVFKITNASTIFPIAENLKVKLAALTKRPSKIYWNDNIPTPMTWGVFTPVILLPKSALDWDKNMLEIVLLHEGIHIRRFDYWWHMVGLLVVSIYWWHPLVWLLKKQQILEREKACDEGVLNLGTPRKAYAQTLVQMAKQLVPSKQLILEQTLSMAKNSQVKQRIMAILQFKSSRKNRMVPQFFTIIFLLFTLPLLAGLSRATTFVSTINLASLATILPVEKLLPISPKKLPINSTEKITIVETKHTIPLSQKSAPVKKKIISFETLPKLNTRLPLVENTPIIAIPNKEIESGLYGEWQEGKSTYKVWTYGDFKTLKHLPFINTTNADAFVIIEETKKTIWGEKKLLLTMTQAPEDGGLIHSFENGMPKALSGGYKKGELVLFWWRDGEWSTPWDFSKDKWMARKLNNIARNLELGKHLDFIQPTTKKDTHWWTVIKQQQQIKKERYFIDDPINNVKPPTVPILKFEDIPYKPTPHMKRNNRNKKVGKTIVTKTKSGCSGCSKITSTKFGTLIKTTATPSFVKTLNLHLANNQFESIQFDMHLYKVKNGQIQYRLTESPVSFKIGQQEKWVKVDLSEHTIPVQGDVLVMLEPREVTGDKRMLFFSLAPSHWIDKPFFKKNQQNLEDFWDIVGLALYFTLK